MRLTLPLLAVLATAVLANPHEGSYGEDPSSSESSTLDCIFYPGSTTAATGTVTIGTTSTTATATATAAVSASTTASNAAARATTNAGVRADTGALAGMLGGAVVAVYALI